MDQASEPRRKALTMVPFSPYQTMAKYWKAWENFMMKKASPKGLKPHTKIEVTPVET